MKTDRYLIFCDGHIEKDFEATETDAEIFYSNMLEDNVRDILYDTMECVKVIRMSKDNFEVE